MAFDTLYHRIMITKLQHYWIRGTSLKWFINYLSDRTQFVAVNDVFSSSKVIQMGVSQGSILGPLQFLIYMNNIPNSSRHLDFILYADDTTLFNTIEISSPYEDSDPFKTINDELHKVSNWLVANRLSLNIKKTKYMIQGIMLDKHISSKAHVEMVSNKISKYCGILTKLNNYLPLDILRTLYLSMIHSHLNYRLIAWGYDCNRLIKLQKRSSRTIDRSKYNAHTSPLLKALEILSLPDMLYLNALKFYYKFVRNETPAYFSTFTITTQSSIQDHNTRNRDNIRTTRTRLNIADKCLRNYLTGKINSTPNNLLSRINTHSIQGFTFAVKNYLLNQYQINCTEMNCYVCQRH